MDLKSTIDIILKDLKEARDIMDDLKNYPDVPEIQVELAKAKCRSAEEVLKFLTEKRNEAMPASRRQRLWPTETGRKERKRENIEKQEEEGGEEKGISSSFTEEATTSKEAETEAQNEPELEADEVIAEKEKSTEEIIDQIIQPEISDEHFDRPLKESSSGKILADKFSKESSINEQIASKRHDKGNDEVSKLKPVGNLADAIGINDRFLYVRELFNGDQDLYKQTITSLNNALNIDDAFDILSKACKSEKDNQTFDQLLDLVKRKLRTR